MKTEGKKGVKAAEADTVTGVCVCVCVCVRTWVIYCRRKFFFDRFS